MLMCVSAMLCGAQSLYAMAQWGRERREDDPELMLRLGLRPGRSPSVATLHRVFKRFDSEAFEKVLGDWLAQTGAPSEGSGDPPLLAVDGKTLRGIHGEGVPGVHLVSVSTVNAQAVLTQVAVSGKGSELSATRKALSQVDLKGKVVAGDALQTQRDVCVKIVEKGGTIFSL